MPDVPVYGLIKELYKEKAGKKPKDAEGFRDIKHRDRAVKEMFKGKKGDDALDSVNAMFPHMMIGHVVLEGDIEEIDSHYNLITKGKNGKTTTSIRTSTLQTESPPLGIGKNWLLSHLVNSLKSWTESWCVERIHWGIRRQSDQRVNAQLLRKNSMVQCGGYKMAAINKRKQSTVKKRGMTYKAKFRPVKDDEVSQIVSRNFSMQEPMFDFAEGITTVRFFTGSDEEHVYEIPTLKDGRIPSSVALMRLIDKQYSLANPQESKPWIDVKETSKHVAPLYPDTNQDRILQFTWWVNPSLMDIQHIDTKDPIWLDVEDAKNQKRAQVVIIGTKAERAAVRKIIEDNFTDKERAMMEGTIIDVKDNDPRKNVAAFYRGAGWVDGTNSDYIAIGSRHLFKTPDKEGPNAGNPINDNALTHELVHLLNFKDAAYRDTVRRIDNDSNEKWTDAETLTRQRGGPYQDNVGYYKDIKDKVHDKSLLEGLATVKKTRRNPDDLYSAEIIGYVPSVAPEILELGIQNARTKKDYLTEPENPMVIKIGRKGQNQYARCLEVKKATMHSTRS